MLAIASSSTCAFSNPFHAAAVRIAEVSIVGLDRRAIANSLSPRRAVDKVLNSVQQRVQHVVMADADAKPRMVGDFGFDPLGLGSDDNFAYYREAEIKHGRLAMLAAVAWPLQELLHPILVDALYDTTGITVRDVLIESNGASPSVLNGGLFQAEVLPALLLFAVGTSALEEKDLNARKELGLGWNEYPESFGGSFGRIPGNFGFDPLNFYKPLGPADKVAVQERELMNGRVAMLAIASYVGTEFFGGAPVIRSTPALFEPIILVPEFRAFLDSAFGMASMDGSINGVAF
jgi:light-harvesting complex I chlorophyll a/b binding protein 1